MTNRSEWLTYTTMKEHVANIPSSSRSGTFMRSTCWGDEGNFPNDAAAKPHVLRRQNSERPARTAYLWSLSLARLSSGCSNSLSLAYRIGPSLPESTWSRIGRVPVSERLTETTRR